MATGANDALGEWIAGLEPWTHMITLTHDRERLREAGDLRDALRYSRVGVQRHVSQLRKWWGDVLAYEPGAAMWHEAEFHLSGQVHGHALLAVKPNAPVLSMRQAWYERCGYALVEPVESTKAAAGYISKKCGIYITKAPIVPPFVRGVRVQDAFGRAGDR